MKTNQGVDWPFGNKQIHHRIQRGGLISAVTESFHPSTPHDYAIFLEDDIEVSPAFYAWSKHLLLRYRYSSDAAHPITLDANTRPTTSLAGISLYTPRIEEVRGEQADAGRERRNAAWLPSHMMFTPPRPEAGGAWGETSPGMKSRGAHSFGEACAAAAGGVASPGNRHVS